MADPKHLGQLRADNPVPSGTIQPADIIHLARAITPGQPQNGVNSYGGTFEEILSFIAANLSTNQLNELLKLEVGGRVNGATGDISGQLPGRVELTGTRVSAGVYEVTTPTGVFAFATATIWGTADSRIAVNGHGSNKLTIYTFSGSSGTAENRYFTLMARLS